MSDYEVYEMGWDAGDCDRCARLVAALRKAEAALDAARLAILNAKGMVGLERDAIIELVSVTNVRAFEETAADALAAIKAAREGRES
jgi:hypothetical protein